MYQKRPLLTPPNRIVEAPNPKPFGKSSYKPPEPQSAAPTTPPDDRNHQRASRPRVGLNCSCPVCGRKFHRSPSAMGRARHGRNFCSPACRAKWFVDEHLNTPQRLRERSRKWSGEGNPKWNEGASRDRHGNPLTRYPNHPRAYKNGYVPQRFLAAEQLLRRSLRRDENVLFREGCGDEPNRLIVYRGTWMLGPTVVQTLLC